MGTATCLLVGFKCNIHYCWCAVTNTHDCWPRVSLNGMCAVSVPHYETCVMLRMWIWWVGGITWPLFSELSTDMPADLKLFNQRCTLVHWKSKRRATWPMSLNYTCQLTLWNFISQGCYLVNKTYMPCRELLCRCSCNVHACWPSVTVRNTAAVQTYLLVECCCKMDACWTMTTQSACLLTFCH